MTSEGTDTLISAFTSITGQFVARYTHRFLFGFFPSERGYIYAFYRPNFLAPDMKGSRERTKQRGIFAFLIDF